jgi:predicted PurR-regulated permease PerM
MLTHDRISRAALIGIFVILAMTALHAAQSVFAPMVTAIVFGIVLSPLANAARSRGLRDVWVAVLVLLGGLVIIALLVLVLWNPIGELIEQAPLIWARIRYAFQDIKESFSGLASLSNNLQELMKGDEAALVVSEEGDELQTALVYAPLALSQLIIFVGALFFFILSRRQIYRAIALLGADHRSRRRLLECIATTERNVSRYFIAITIINAALGVATYIVLLSIGMPSAALWAVLAAGLNFVPYLGPAIMTVLLAIGSVVTFSGAYVFLPPLSFVALNVLEGQFLTPAIVGRTLTMNPLLVFMSLVFWIWLWGPIGGFIAIPLMLIGLSFLSLRTPQRHIGQPNTWVHTISGGTKGKFRPKFSAARTS